MRRLVNPRTAIAILLIGIGLLVWSGNVPWPGTTAPVFSSPLFSPDTYLDPTLFWTAMSGMGAIVAAAALLLTVYLSWPQIKVRFGWAKPEETKPQLSENQQKQNRQAMLAQVKHSWVEGVLDKSLYGAVMMELGLAEKAEAVQRPWESVLRLPDQKDEVLPAGTRLVEVFDQVGQALLILGEPGSGKTTMLLDLTRDLIGRARRDSSRPVPVVFNLSSWAGGKQSIADWLVEELRSKYSINRPLGQAWIEENALALMLDGLDEVAVERREACVVALNAFREAHSLVPMVVCSRIKDYAVLATRLNLPGAVAIQPLEPAQIERYLDGAGVELMAVRRSLGHDETLRELAETPLMLSIMTLAYKGKQVEELGSLGSVEARRGHIFDHYIETVLVWRGGDGRYAARQTKAWLSWLAERLVRHEQSVFLVENMQPGWMGSRWQRWWYRLLVRLPAELSVDYRDQIKTTDVLKWTWESTVDGMISGLIYGLVYGLIYGLVFGLREGLVFGLSLGLVWGLINGLSTRTAIGTLVKPNEGIWRSLKNGLVFGLSVGLIMGLLIGLTLEVNLGVLVGLVVGLLVGLRKGGRAFIQHFALRFVLSRQGYLPWNLVPFLDYAADCILLRKVGGGYIFIHRLLMEHMAKMER